MTNKETCVIVPNEWHIDIVTNEMLVVYTTLQRYCNLNRKECITTINIIKDLLRFTKRNATIINKIKLSLDQLIEVGYLDIYDLNHNRVDIQTIGNNDTILCKIKLPEDNYFKVHDYAIDSILDYLSEKGGKINKFSILRYYMSICRVIHNDDYFGYLSNRKVHKVISKNETIRKYNNILSNLKLIVYNNDYITKDNRNCTTYFGEFTQQEKFNKFLDYQIKNKNLTKK